MLRKTLIGAAALAVTTSLPAAAHHPSGVSSTGDAGPINTISATTLAQGQSAAAVMFEVIKLGAFSDAQLTSFAGRHIHAHSLDEILSPSLTYAYGVTDHLTMLARLPFIARQGIREGEHHHLSGGIVNNTAVDLGDASGIGDLTLLGQYRFLDNHATGTEAALLVGVKAPTGRTGVNASNGVRFDTEFQPGTGSWDGLVGLAFTQRVGLWSFDANVLYVLATEGALDTDLGDRFQYNAAVSYRIIGPSPGPRAMYAGALPEPMYHSGPHRHAQAPRNGHSHHEPPAGPALDLVLELNGEWHAKQDIAGVRDANSGGNVIYLAPGLRLSQGNWSGFVSVGVPVLNDMNGVQAEPDWRLLTGLAVSF
jgi:hypothetical protein